MEADEGAHYQGEDSDEVAALNRLGSHCVVCVRCKTVRRGFGPTQANNCAADWDARRVIGFYGSSVCDMTVLRPTGKAAIGLAPGLVCDPCLTELLEEGALAVAAETDTFGAELPGTAPEAT